MQDILHRKLGKAGRGARIGYKIGCTTVTMQEILGVPHPCAGCILANDSHRSGATLRLHDYVKAGIEVEIAMQMSDDLPVHLAPFDRETVAAAIGACMASLELIDGRTSEFKALGLPGAIADDFSGAGCVLGPPVVDWQAIDLATVVGRDEGSEVMGHPLNAWSGWPTCWPNTASPCAMATWC